jgi:hypothetical protein
MLMFMLGSCYTRMMDCYEGESFFNLAKIIQNSISKNTLSNIELERTYKVMYEQESLSDVLGLIWFKRHKKKFDDQNPESLMIRKPDTPPKEDMQVDTEDVKEDPDYERSAFSDDEEEEMPAFMKDVEPVNIEIVKNVKSNPYRELLAAQMIEDNLQRDAMEKENQKLIKAMMEEEQNYERQHSENRKQQEMESMIAAQRLQDDFESEEIKIREEEEEKNKPECTICFDTINYSDIIPLTCGHIYHPYCILPYIKSKVEDKVFPITCPDPKCGIEFSDAELKIFCDRDLYDKMVEFQFKLFVEQNNDMFNQCPTADCPFIFQWDGDKENQRFDCKICNKQYCIMCRVEWHEGMTCSEYRELNGYPPEDRLFYKFIKGTPFKQCPKCKFWVEKSEGCDHMTCRCKFQFCYICGGTYQACACMKK